MRRLGALAVFAALAVSCGANQEPVASTSTTNAGTVAPPTTTTTEPATVVTTAAPTVTTAAPTTTLPLLGLTYEEVAVVGGFPVLVAPAPGDDRLYIVEKQGTIRILGDDGVLDDPFLDISGAVRNNREQGLLGLAFSPDFAASGRFYVHYTISNGDGRLSEFTAEPGSDRVDPSTERILLTIDQPASNHNGGMLQFGPDGFLYLALGDGGRSNDRFGNGQRPDTILGTILRMDVLQITVAGDPPPPIATPGDNPFVDGGGDPLVWAYGLRNPWRFWIDEQSSEIYIADVGQRSFEEIDVVPLEPAGYNFGWPITEALHCFSPSNGCDTAGLTLPFVEIAHSDAATCSVTGGVTYRGSAIPELTGHYLYSDFCGGYLRSFLAVDGQATEQTDWTDQVGTLRQVTSFGVDSEGEVLVVSAEGAIYRIVPER